MSGTSLDGLDLALCEFKQQGSGFTFKLIKSKTLAYTPKLKKRLFEIKDASALDYFAFNAEYGRFIALQVNAFLKDAKAKPLAIASHGHTVFHQPKSGFSTQIGHGATIAAHTGITTICDFRSTDVALGGQGAPLVPLGDKLLFGEFDACLNIGGIANISFEKQGKRLAYDICEANMLLNTLSEKAGKTYDSNGRMAASGKINSELLNKLNTIKYYKQSGAKSIGREWFEKNIEPLFKHSQLSVHDQLATATAHIAQTIGLELSKHALQSVLITGGGAFNTHLVDLIMANTRCKVILPSNDIINFKEALIFAFLGYLRLINKPNALASVTGATKDSVSGAVYLP